MPRAPEEVAAGVWRVVLELPGDTLYVNVYVMRDEDGKFVLVDTGWRNPAYLELLDDGIKKIGGRLEDVSQVAVTHGHPDHSGLARAIHEVSGATLFLGEEDAPMLQRMHGPERMQQWQEYSRAHGMDEVEYEMRSGRGPSTESTEEWMRMQEEPPPDTEHPPDKLDKVDLHAVWTPGHSPGHACFHMPSQRTFFSGDHVLPHITPNVSLHPGTEGNPVGEFVDSLHKVRDIDVDLVLPAHGEPWNDLAARVDEILHHHDERMTEILTALDGAARQARFVAANVTWKRQTFDEMPHWSQRMAIGETLAHLRHLVVEGQVDETTDEHGRIWYALR